jgi:predicted dehydrogenase
MWFVMIKIGIIGCGHWGPNHIRMFSSLPNSTVAMVADPDRTRLEYISEQYSNISIHKDYKEMVESPNVDAVVISTPTHTHYEIVKDSLLAGKHVLCEKPLCIDVKEAEELVALAKDTRRVLMIGYIFLFNRGIIKLKELLKHNELGNVYYLSAIRTNLGPIRNDVNVVYDLATHDISIFNFLLDSLPLEVSGVGVAFLQESIQDIGFISLKYPNNIIAHIRVSWLDPKKVRHITIVGDKKMATWDDLAEMGPVIVYDKGVIKEPYYSNYGEFQLLTREGDVIIPKVKMEEPLKAQSAYFLSCLKKGDISISNGTYGINVVKVLAAITNSMALGGQPVAVR